MLKTGNMRLRSVCYLYMDSYCREENEIGICACITFCSDNFILKNLFHPCLWDCSCRNSHFNLLFFLFIANYLFFAGMYKFRDSLWFYWEKRLCITNHVVCGLFGKSYWCILYRAYDSGWCSGLLWDFGFDEGIWE